MSARMDGLLRDAAESGAVPGVVAMAATRDGPVYQGAFGRRALPDGAPMTVDTVFWIASMTKAITSAAAMQLVEQGRIGLDDPLGPVVPELAAPRVLEGFDDGGNPRLRAARRPVTLRQLLTHTAGFGYDMWNEELRRYYEATGLPRTNSGRAIALTAPLIFEPGERWNYGINTDMVGRVVEVLSGERLDTYFRTHLFEPLGMTDTGFRLTPDRQARLVGMHQRRADGSLEPIPFVPPADPELYMGGGGLHGTATDYVRFQRMILNEGTLDGVRVLKPETVRLMAENHIGALDVCRLATAVPALSNDAEFMPSMKKKWGLGFLINTEAVEGGRSAGSLAWAGLRNTYFWIDPVRGVSGVLMTQLLPFADPTVLALFAAFEKAVYAALDA